jgi:uncharacterized protein
MGLMGPNIEWQEPDVEGLPLRGTHHGLEDVANNVFGATGKNWDDFQAVPEEFLDVGDRVIMLRHFQGGRKATGRTLDTPFAHVWTLRDGKLVHHRNYVDTAKVYTHSLKIAERAGQGASRRPLPSFLPLFTRGVRGRGILRSSRRNGAGGIISVGQRVGTR